MLILHVAVPGRAGGLETVVEGLARGHRCRGHRVMVAAVLAQGLGEPPLLARMESDGVVVHRIEIHPKAYLKERRLVRQLCRQYAPDIVHTHGPRCDVLHLGTARRLGIPAVTTVHGSSKQKGLMPVYELLQERLWFRRFDAVVAVSKPILDTIGRYGISGTRLHLVPNAWDGSVSFLSRNDARQVLGIPANSRCIGWVGRFIPAKGADVLLDAVAALEDPDLFVSLVGDGPERATLEAQARSLGIDGQVRFHGTIDVAARTLRAFDMLVLSSRTEGTPMVLLEAMAAGVPMLVTTVGGVPGMVGDEEALRVAPEDPLAMAEAVRVGLSDRVSAGERAQRAHQRLHERFSVGPWLDQYEAIYAALASGTKG